MENKELTLADHAELWAKENGIVVPSKDTTKYEDMYRKWIEYAFADF